MHEMPNIYKMFAHNLEHDVLLNAISLIYHSNQLRFHGMDKAIHIAAAAGKAKVQVWFALYDTQI